MRKGFLFCRFMARKQQRAAAVLVTLGEFSLQRIICVPAKQNKVETFIFNSEA